MPNKLKSDSVSINGLIPDGFDDDDDIKLLDQLGSAFDEMFPDYKSDHESEDDVVELEF